MSITSKTQKKLETHLWRIHTNDAITQRAVTEELARRNINEAEYRGKIFYDGKEVIVFVVGFDIVLFLSKNRKTNSYMFTSYHKENRPSAQWTIWKEGETSPIQKLDSLVRKGLLTRGAKV